MPYSTLFKQSAAVIHCGGIGTIGWSLKYALPSLLVPSEWDQFDNANRVGNEKLATVIAGGKYNVTQMASSLENLLSDEALRDRLRQTAAIVEKEDGAEVARLKIEAELENL